jgi:hypothetical protein
MGKIVLLSEHKQYQEHTQKHETQDHNIIQLTKTITALRLLRGTLVDNRQAVDTALDQSGSRYDLFDVSKLLRTIEDDLTMAKLRLSREHKRTIDASQGLQEHFRRNH